MKNEWIVGIHDGVCTWYIGIDATKTRMTASPYTAMAKVFKNINAAKRWCRAAQIIWKQHITGKMIIRQWTGEDGWSTHVPISKK